MIQVYRKSSIRKKEIPLRIAFSFLALFAGAFLISFDIIVHARFFETMGYKYLATAYIFSGILGMYATYLYSVFFREIPTKVLNYIIALLALLTIGLYLILDFFYFSQILYFYGMILLFPINNLVLLAIWRFGRKLLKNQQSKEIIPKVKRMHWAGLALGAGTSAFISMCHNISYISLFCLVTLLSYFICHNILYHQHKSTKIFSDGHERFVPVSNNLFLFFTSKLSTNLMLFAILSAAIGFSIHYTFINIATAGFQNVIGLSKFYSLFLTTMMIFIFGVDRFLIKKILYTNDSPFSLVLIPFIVLSMVLVTIAVYFFFSNIKPYEHFTLFFLLLTLTKVGYESVKFIIQIPSQRSLFQTLDIRYKQVIYPSIEGMGVMFGLILSGVVLLVLSYIPGFKLNYILYWIAFLCILWIFTAIRLIRIYKKSQINNLNRLRRTKTNVLNDNTIEQIQWEATLSADKTKLAYILDHLRKYNFSTYKRFLISLLSHHNKEIREEVYLHITDNRVFHAISDLKKQAKQQYGAEKNKILKSIEKLNKELSIYQSQEEIDNIVYGDSKEKKNCLAKATITLNHDIAEELLSILIKENDESIQTEAINTLSSLKPIRFNYSLLDLLYPENYIPSAIFAIANSGDEAIDYLEREQLLSQTPAVVKARIEKIYGKISSPNSINKIISNLSQRDSFLLKHSIQALIDSSFQADQTTRFKILTFIIRNIGILTRNLSIYEVLQKKTPNALLTEAFRQEIDKNYNLIFSLLSLIYNPHIINGIKDICLNGNLSEVNHGIELADLYIDEDVKSVLLPLLENITLKERIKKLEYFFIQPKFKIEDILSYCLTTDFDHLSIFPRVCAIQQMRKWKSRDFERELVFNIHHPIEIIKHIATDVLKDLHPSNPALLENSDDNIENRLFNKQKTNKPIDTPQSFLLFLELKEISFFQQFSEEVLLELAEDAKKIKLNKADIVNIEAESMLYQLLFLNSKTLKVGNNCLISSFGNLIDLDLLKSYGPTHISFPNEAEIWLFRKKAVENLIYNNIDFVAAYFKSIKQFTVTKK